MVRMARRLNSRSARPLRPAHRKKAPIANGASVHGAARCRHRETIPPSYTSHRRSPPCVRRARRRPDPPVTRLTGTSAPTPCPMTPAPGHVAAAPSIACERRGNADASRPADVGRELCHVKESVLEPAPVIGVATCAASPTSATRCRTRRDGRYSATGVPKTSPWVAPDHPVAGYAGYMLWPGS